jgi:uncharacterized protein (TIGR04255 family)
LLTGVLIMPNKKLSNSPLTYVLAQIRISSVEEISSYVPKLQEAIRKEFPIYKKVDIQTVELKNEAAPNIQTSTQWHFKDKESLVGIIVDRQAITIHTSKYNGFDAFNLQIKKILERFNKILEISLSTRVGLRYINIIQSNLKKYVHSSLLGFYEEADDNFLANVETTHKTEEGFIKVRAIHPRNATVIHQEKLVPPNLITSADQLSFKHYGEVNKEYIMLDIDNFHQKQRDFNVIDITKTLSKLHERIYKTFCVAVTKEALKNWK